jgi:DNA/RNA-binding protein KIN17
VLKLDQSHVETVIPSVDKRVMIVNGAYRGCKATLKSINVDKFCCTVKIDEGLYTGRSLENVDYEDVCKLAT